MKANEEWFTGAAGTERKTPVYPMAYLEESIGFSGDSFQAAAQIAEAGFSEHYLLYENGEELSLGLGIHALLTVDRDYATLTTDSRTLQFENAMLSETLDRIFSTVRLTNWRAYGIANFGLARYNHQLPLLSEDKCLLKLFIPQAEVRFTPGSILVRTLGTEAFAGLSRLVKQIAADGQNKNFEQYFAGRLSGQKLQVPAAGSYKADEYMQMVATAVGEIQAGSYQKVILSRKIPLDCELDMVASYLAGRSVNSPARSFLLALDGLQAAGFSPETVVEVDRQGWVSTLPLAGTRACGISEEEDGRLRAELVNDPKEIAEHAVSVKLAFEELQRVCAEATIAVSDFMSVAKRGTVQHIASRLKGKLKPGYNSWHAFNTLFPAVTASGIPKQQSIAAIGRLEQEARNLYSGCVLTYDSDGALDAALVLRTIFQQDKQAWLHAGAGIVEMSVPARELEETREKLSSVTRQLVPASQSLVLDGMG